MDQLSARPQWATELVARAERATNARDLDAISRLYGRDAELEVVGPHGREVHVGRETVVRAWAAMLAEADDVGLEVAKHLLVAAGSVVAAAWHGRTAIAVTARGLDVFWLTHDLVQRHLLTFGAAGPGRAEANQPE